MGDDGMVYLRYIYQYIQDEHQDKKKAPMSDAHQWILVPGTNETTPLQQNGTLFIFHLFFSSRLDFDYLLTHFLYRFINSLECNITGYDCGVFTCMVADFLSKGCSLEFDQSHVTRYARERITLAILNGSAVI
jgi:hypothetical protein